MILCCGAASCNVGRSQHPWPFPWEASSTFKLWHPTSSRTFPTVSWRRGGRELSLLLGKHCPKEAHDPGGWGFLRSDILSCYHDLLLSFICNHGNLAHLSLASVLGILRRNSKLLPWCVFFIETARILCIKHFNPFKKAVHASHEWSWGHFEWTKERGKDSLPPPCPSLPKYTFPPCCALLQTPYTPWTYKQTAGRLEAGFGFSFKGLPSAVPPTWNACPTGGCWLTSSLFLACEMISLSALEPSMSAVHLWAGSLVHGFTSIPAPETWWCVSVSISWSIFNLCLSKGSFFTFFAHCCLFQTWNSTSHSPGLQQAGLYERIKGTSPVTSCPHALILRLWQTLLIATRTLPPRSQVTPGFFSLVLVRPWRGRSVTPSPFPHPFPKTWCLSL